MTTTPTTTKKTSPVWFFGCNEVSGHYLFLSANGFVSRPNEYPPAGCPWKHLDGNLAPRSTTPTASDKFGSCYGRPTTYEVPQGHAALHHKDDWTALAFWDRTGDTRGASNSVFLTHDVCDFDEMVRRSREAFPTIWARFPFAVTLVERK